MSTTALNNANAALDAAYSALASTPRTPEAIKDFVRGLDTSIQADIMENATLATFSFEQLRYCNSGDVAELM